MDNKASLTALMSAFGRAYHAASHADPVFDDFLARALMSDAEYAAIGGHILSGLDFFAPDKRGSFADDSAALCYLVDSQIAPTPLARARCTEDALARSGLRQYVILGAGLDSFAFRRRDYAETNAVFELDHPLTQRDKRARIERAGWTLPAGLRFVPVDFSADDPARALREAGFDEAVPAFFSWLGVSYYLTRAQIEATLESLRALAAPGSLLVFDFADEGLFESGVRRVQSMLAMAKAGGEAMQSCFSQSEIEETLSRHGFRLRELLCPEQIQARYFEGRGEALRAFEHVCYATAILD